MSNHRKRKMLLGRSMVEMLGMLAIAGVLSVGGLIGYSVAMVHSRMNTLQNEMALSAVTHIEELIKHPQRYSGTGRWEITRQLNPSDIKINALKDLDAPLVYVLYFAGAGNAFLLEYFFQNVSRQNCIHMVKHLYVDKEAPFMSFYNGETRIAHTLTHARKEMLEICLPLDAETGLIGVGFQFPFPQEFSPQKFFNPDPETGTPEPKSRCPEGLTWVVPWGQPQSAGQCLDLPGGQCYVQNTHTYCCQPDEILVKAAGTDPSTDYDPGACCPRGVEHYNNERKTGCCPPGKWAMLAVGAERGACCDPDAAHYDKNRRTYCCNAGEILAKAPGTYVPTDADPGACCPPDREHYNNNRLTDCCPVGMKARIVDGTENGACCHPGAAYYAKDKRTYCCQPGEIFAKAPGTDSSLSVDPGKCCPPDQEHYNNNKKTDCRPK